MNVIIPAPARNITIQGKFEITAQTPIYYSKGMFKGKRVANYFADFMAVPLDGKMPVKPTDKVRPIKKAILFTNAGAPEKLGDEGYQLIIKPETILIRACKAAGLFYGLQSLRQLLPAGIEAGNKYKGKITVQCCKIEDLPRFKWRGMHYDPCRRFFGKEHIFEYIDLLAKQKFNVLHWHLTEDQGWRIEIKKYPALAEISAWRNGTDNPYWESKGNRKKHGGYYTQDDIREIVKYAADRFITIVPEIEMPGHAKAALAAYPELSCNGGPHKVWTRWGVSKDVYCAGNEKVFKFLEDVLEEVLELFPSKYIHIGGDECPKDRWEECPKCQARIKKERLKDEYELQNYFITRMEKFLNAKGRKIIGWDEILEGGLAPNAAVMSWRGFDGGLKAASMGHYVVMTPTSHTYFDLKPIEQVASGRDAVLSLEQVYSFDPTEGFKPSWKKYIMGGQGAMWSEFINNIEEFNIHLLPRSCALAEVFWSPQRGRNYKDFKKRVTRFTKRLDAMDITHSESFVK